MSRSGDLNNNMEEENQALDGEQEVQGAQIDQIPQSPFFQPQLGQFGGFGGGMGPYGGPPAMGSFDGYQPQPQPRFGFDPLGMYGPRRPPPPPLPPHRHGMMGPGFTARGRHRRPPQFGRPATAFILFFQKMLKDRCNRGRRVADVAKEASQQWRALPPQEKAMFRRIYCHKVQLSEVCGKGRGRGGPGEHHGPGWPHPC